MFNEKLFNKFFENKEVKMISFDVSIAGLALAASLAGLSGLIAATGGSVISGGGSTTVVIGDGGGGGAIVNSVVEGAMGAAEAGGFCGTIADLLAAGAISIFLCWVAREVYGQDNIKWQLFRSWMLNQSPKWFLKLYINHGENTAKFLKNKTILKNAIKICMDYIISNKLKTEYNFAI
jgi:hypothetical protein